MKSIKNAVIGLLGIVILAGATYFANPGRIVDRDTVTLSSGLESTINKTADGSLGGFLKLGVNPSIYVVDKDADGTADYIRYSFVAQRMGYEAKENVPDSTQSLYQETFNLSKFNQ